MKVGAPVPRRLRDKRGWFQRLRGLRAAYDGDTREIGCSECLPFSSQVCQVGFSRAGSSWISPSLRAPSLPQARLAALADQWQFLVQKSAEKSQKLKEANKQQNFNTGIKDFDFWLSEVMPRCLVILDSSSVSKRKAMEVRALPIPF